jgi:hypothetical protein
MQNLELVPKNECARINQRGDQMDQPQRSRIDGCGD